jgi:SAM-dependent methyltransferase
LFLRVAAGRGYEAAGLELHQGNAERLRAEGFRVVDRPLEDAGFGPDSFDLVTLWEVLEHIVEPARLLERIRRVLAPGGAAFILVPNADSLASRVLHEKSGTFGGHSHVNFFNRRTLQRLLNLTGFDLIEAETIVSELGTVTNHLNFEDPYLGNRREAFDFLTPELIHDRLMGSKLLAVARPAS